VKRLVAAFGAVLLIGSAALGHEGATGVVKQRMDEMEHVGRVVKRINERLKSKRGLVEIANDAAEIKAAAGRVPSLFPPGSRDGHSEAKPAVWERWPEFVALRSSP
jgi:cytochrome c556